jgi:hypothetical protein
MNNTITTGTISSLYGNITADNTLEATYGGTTMNSTLSPSHSSHTVIGSATGYYPSLTLNNSTAIELVDKILHVRGDAEFDGNVKVGGVELNEFMKKIAERLEILQVNKELESEWEELRELGDKYRALEAKLLDAKKVWDIMKS